MSKKLIFTGLYLLIFVASFLSIVVLLSEFPMSKAATIEVGPSQTYTTIQEGIDAADPGDTVNVHSGIYYENVIVNKTINLTGENKETTIIDGMGGSEVVFIEADYVNVSGFTVRNGVSGIWINPSNYSNIVGNVICNISGWGVIIAGTNHSIEQNTIHNTTECITFTFSSEYSKANNNYLYNNTEGIHMMGDYNIISNNYLYNTTQYGFFITGSYNELYNNIIFNSEGAGIEFSNIQCTNNKVVNNTINNTKYGLRIIFSAKNVTVHNCSIVNSNNESITLHKAQNCTFINSSIINSGTDDSALIESNAVFLNTSFNKTKVHFYDNSSTLTIQWFMHIYVNDIGNNPISTADVEVYNLKDDLVMSGKTDEDGFLKWIVVTERIQNYSTNITHTPHNVTAIKDSFVGYATPEPIMDSSKQVNITLMIPQPLHHIEIAPAGPEFYYIGDSQTYIAIGWDDAAETLMNLTWTPIWNIDNTSIATINSNTGFFTAIALGNSVVNVTSSELTGIYATSPFTVEPWPLNHIVISPVGPEYYYIGDAQTYTAIGWNDPAETQQNTTWSPVWSVDNTSLASIDSATGECTALAMGNSLVNITDSILSGVYNTSIFTIEPWPLHHIVITPVGPERYYIGDERTYTAIGWNDAAETQENTSWTPVWSVDNTSIAMIDLNAGTFTANALGSSAVNVTSEVLSGIYNTSTFVVEPWPLHHIVITPAGPENYHIGDTQTYTALGWNDAAETQMNDTWTPVWIVNDTSLANIDQVTGEFKALALGNGFVRVTNSIFTGIYDTSLFCVDPWPLHHIEIIPVSDEDHYYIGDTKIYTAMGWNDAGKTQSNNSWIPVWSIKNSSIAQIWEGDFLAIALGSSEINVSCASQPWIYALRSFTVHPWPLHHISITPVDPQTLMKGDDIEYSVIGWNDDAETQQNDSWSPIWSVVGGIGEIIGEGYEVTFLAKKPGKGAVKCSGESTNILVSSEIVVKEKSQDESLLWLWILLAILLIILCLIMILLLFRKKAQRKDEGAS